MEKEEGVGGGGVDGRAGGWLRPMEREMTFLYQFTGKGCYYCENAAVIHITINKRALLYLFYFLNFTIRRIYLIISKLL